MSRTDTHRPGHAGFDPQNYTFTGVVIDNDNITTGDRDNIDQAATGRDLPADHRCGHCGAYLRYAALLNCATTGELIWVGQTCLSSRFSGMTKAQFAALQAAAKAAREAAAISKARAALIESHPHLGQLADLCGDGNEFVNSLHWQLQNKGALSDKQIAAAEGAVTRAIAYAAKRAQWDAERAAVVTVPAPLGRQAITGTVIKISTVESYFNGREVIRDVMTVKHADGWCAWGTLPTSLAGDWTPETGTIAGVKVGDTVTLTATLALFDDEDPKVDFVKYTRPTKASIAA